MTKIDLSQFKPIPGFDSLKWKQEVQTKIYEETKHMTPEERRERTRQASERMRKEREQYQAEQAAGDSTVPVFTMQ
jgi:hypothetical protein